MNNHLGLANKVKNDYNKKESIDSIIPHYDTQAEYLRSIGAFIKNENFKMSAESYKNTIFWMSFYNVDQYSENKYRDHTIYSHEMTSPGAGCSVKFTFNYSWGDCKPKKSCSTLISICITDFVGYNSATFHVVLVDEKLYITNGHDFMVKSTTIKRPSGKVAKLEKFYEFSESTTYILMKVIDFFESLDNMSIAAIAHSIMKNGNICGGNIALYDIEDQVLCKFRNKTFSRDSIALYPLSSEDLIKSVTLEDGPNEWNHREYFLEDMIHVDVNDYIELKKQKDEEAKRRGW